MSHGLATIVTILLTGLAWGDEPGTPLERALDRLRDLESRTASIELVDAPADEAFAELASQAGVPVWVDWESLRALGIRDRDRVTVHVPAAPASTALHAITLALGDATERPVIEADAGRIVVTSRRGAEPLRHTRVYDLRRVLRDEAAITVAEEALRESLQAADPIEHGPIEHGPIDDGPMDETPGEGAPGDPIEPTGPPPMRRDVPVLPPEGLAPRRAPIPPPHLPPVPDLPDPPQVEAAPAPRLPRLVRLLMDHVDPDTWVGLGGVQAKMDETDGLLVVTASPRIHLELERLVDQLNTMQVESVPVEIVVVRVPGAPYELLRRRLGPGSAALARAVVELADSTVLWRSRTIASPNHVASAACSAGSASTSVVIEPSFERTLGRVTLVTSVEVTDGGRTSSVQGAVVTGTHGAGLLELPATPAPSGGAGETTQLLVVLLIG